MSDSSRGACDLCEAARLSEWFHEDDLCWIAECEVCSVPMVVWRVHDPNPPEAVKQRLHELLRSVVGELFVDEIYIDDNMRNIPDHYHAHARGRGKWGMQPLERRRPNEATG
ncbi:MAG: hypothetical protein ACO28Q_00945 [Ilumatobacteraceae bacterium]